MKNLKKAVALLLCAVLLVAGSVMGTLAYLTAQDDAQNTFTVGDVAIILDEFDIDGSKTGVINEGRDSENEYKGANKLVPGCKHLKDPTVWVKEGSELSYVRMLVEVTKLDELKAALPKEDHADYYGAGDVFLLQNLVEGWNKDVWEFAGVDGNVYEFRYHEKVVGVADDNDGQDDYVSLPALFTHIKLPGEGLNNAEMATLNGLQVNVKAQAIQALGFEDDVDAAWTAFEKQNKVNP